MTNNELIEKLVKLGWSIPPHSKPNDINFYLWNEFEITHTNELEKYNKNHYIIKGEKIYLHYRIYPNTKSIKWYVWSIGGHQRKVIFYDDNYNDVINLILQDKLLTYPNNYHWLEKIAFKFNLNLNQLAEKMQVNRSTLYKIVERKTDINNVTFGTIKKLANALNITIDELIKIIERLSA